MSKYPVRHTLKMWAEDDRPREKLLSLGFHALSNTELIAILIGSGSRKKNAVELAREILAAFDDKLTLVSKATIAELTRFEGIGTAKAIAIAAALELGKRRLKEKSDPNTAITSSTDAFNLIAPFLIDLTVEEFWVAFLNRANKPVAIKSISKGGIHGTVVDVRVIFKKAVELLATSIVLFHNHPSGNLNPSTQDDRITKQLKDAGKLMDILILDHLIVSDKSYFSYADTGRLS